MYPGSKFKKNKQQNPQQPPSYQQSTNSGEYHQNQPMFPMPNQYSQNQPNTYYPQSNQQGNQPNFPQPGQNFNAYSFPVNNHPNQQQPFPIQTQQIPNNQPHPQQIQNVSVSNCQGRKRAVFVGINYFGQKGELRGCINDVNNIRSFLCQNYNFSSNNMWILTDDQKHQPGNLPTRENITRAMHWLVQGAQPNDSFFFHFSGHGGQQADTDGDEDDGFDETILPLDYSTKGQITDDEMNAIMVKSLPPGARLTALFDSCHSGTALDLPYVYDGNGNLIKYNPKKAVMTSAMDIGKKYMMGDTFGALKSLKDGFSLLTKGSKADKVAKETRSSMADVIMFSGCKDSQTSADAHIDNKSTGAMSYALIKALSNNPNGYTYISLLNTLRDILRSGYSQIPQLSSGRPMDMNQMFIM